MATYDVFVSYAHADAGWVKPLVGALRAGGLRVFFDESEIADFAGITRAVGEGLARSKALLACYSVVYPTRRACQWELTAAYLAASRQGDPARRVLVVNPEPGAEHIVPHELRDALFRRAPAVGDRAGAAGLAGAVAGHVAGLAGTLGAVAGLVGPRWVPVQGTGSTRFVGRLPEMWRVHAALHPRESAVTVGRSGPAAVQLVGLGGVGKSLLAEEYALRFGAAYPGGVFWLRAYGSHDTVAPEELEARRSDELRGIALGLSLDVADRDPAQLPGVLAAEIVRRGQPCLWVVDDLPAGLTAEGVRGWLAPHPLAATMVTTRSRSYGGIVPAVDVDVLEAGEAYELLTARRAPDGEGEQEAAQRIVAALGHHALAVDVAGAGLRNQAGLVSYADFLAKLGVPAQDELELIADLADALPNGHETSIARTLLRSIDPLDEPGRDVLRLASLLAAPIPARLIATTLARADDLDDDQAARQAGLGLEQASSLSLATQADGTWSVHTLVARTMRLREQTSARLEALRTAAVTLLAEELTAIEDARAWVGLQDVVPHARHLTQQATDLPEAALLSWVAHYDYQRGAFASARILFEQVLDVRQRLLGPDHPDTLTSMNNLAETLRELGDLTGARTLMEQALDGFQRLLGPDHPNTLRAMNNLALTLHTSGDVTGARTLHRQTLNACRRLLGPDHPNTLQSMNNLAETLHDLGDLAGARDLHEQTLDARRWLLGPDHPNTLQSVNNLAGTVGALGDLAGARDLHEQVVEARRRLLGPEHPNTLISMNNLASALHRLGNLTGALTLMEQALDGFQRLLGAAHPDTRLTRANLDAIIRDQRRRGVRRFFRRRAR